MNADADKGFMTRLSRDDGSAGDVDYGAIGGGYAVYRQPDPRIEAFIDRALGSARHILNVGAGAGSCESLDRDVSAVEPSAAMRRQRPSPLSVAIDARQQRSRGQRAHSARLHGRLS